jgi:glycosyltransferase involved in cell wall biosynthesis
MGDPWVFILNEAMYFSNPVIASTAVGAAPDMIKGNGFIVPEQNSTEIFNAMYKILNDEKLEDKMRKRSKEIINNDYQYSNMVNSFEETINTIIKQ